MRGEKGDVCTTSTLEGSWEGDWIYFPVGDEMGWDRSRHHCQRMRGPSNTTYSSNLRLAPYRQLLRMFTFGALNLFLPNAIVTCYRICNCTHFQMLPEVTSACLLLQKIIYIKRQVTHADDGCQSMWNLLSILATSARFEFCYWALFQTANGFYQVAVSLRQHNI
jgi:hypothetical protein